MKKSLITLILFGSLCSLITFGQAPLRPTSAQLFEDIQKLQVLGSALFVAAHPDDENTRLIAYLANELKVDITYLSLTRGDGGQNLIGTEIRELLGVIRTQELLAARRIDGGKQLFTRANDFGYSKHPAETMDLWQKDEVLSDVVWAIRKTRPDIMINRFNSDSAGKTHGHHTASAIISEQAFDLSGRNDIFPEQFHYHKSWQSKRIYFNTSWWFYGSREKFAEVDKSNMAQVDVGVYYPIKGKSNNEIAGLSRSQHRCQGMGNAGNRGTHIEYLEFLKGEKARDINNLFEGIDLSWTRVQGGAPVKAILTEIEDEFNFSAPWNSVDKLLKAKLIIEGTKDEFWKEKKLNEINELIKGCLGLYLDAVSVSKTATIGDSIAIKTELVLRSPVNVVLKSIRILPYQKQYKYSKEIPFNESFKETKKILLTKNLSITNAYWLNHPSSIGMYTVPEQNMRGLPETPKPLSVEWNFVVDRIPVSLVTPISFKKTLPEKGEEYAPFEITEPVFVNLKKQVFIFGDDQSQKVDLVVKAGKENIKGAAHIVVPEGWKITPDKQDFQIAQKDAESILSFTLSPPNFQSEGNINPVVQIADKRYTKSLKIIRYDHIPTQTVLQECQAKIVKIDLQRLGRNIGYIMGAGDEIPTSLNQIGYEVSLIEPVNIHQDNLEKFDAVILGVRAFNTVDRLKYANQELMRYVENGGTLIVQYNTRHRMVTKEIGPYPIKLSRKRVTVEEAEVRMLNPDHELMNFPNKITSADFKGWVQERGLYFPDEWDEKYTEILSSNDPEEEALDGGLLVAPYGKGHYIHTSYSWFRQLPAGVPGAFRIFANMISIGQQGRP